VDIPLFDITLSVLKLASTSLTDSSATLSSRTCKTKVTFSGCQWDEGTIIKKGERWGSHYSIMRVFCELKFSIGKSVFRAWRDGISK
jgi:hypothetical protein